MVRHYYGVGVVRVSVFDVNYRTEIHINVWFRCHVISGDTEQNRISL